MTPVPDFPNELVEAAAVVCYSLAPEHDTSTYPHGYVPYDEARPSSCENARADALEVLTALYPLIEQRVIDRLAGEAGENPYRDLSMPLLSEACKIEAEVWDAGAACGVAAERARCPLCDHEWRRHDPEDGMCDCHDETAIGPCRCGRDLAWVQERIAAMSSAALAPERTGEGA